VNDMSIISFFAVSCETREVHRDPDLRTHYYRNSFEQCLKALKEYAEKEQMDVKQVNPTHGEIYLLGSGFDVIVTALQLSPIETGVDLKVNIFNLIGFNRPKKRALSIYKHLDSTLNFKGISLHP